MKKTLAQNTIHFDSKLSFLKEVIEYRLKDNYTNEIPVFLKFDKIMSDDSLFSKFVREKELSLEEVITLLLAIVPHISPDFFTKIISDFLPNGGGLPDFGGVKGKNHRGIIPTGETVQFIVAGSDIQKRMQLTEMFYEEHLFFKEGVLYLGTVPMGEPKMSGRLMLAEEYIELFTTGNILKPSLSKDFLAERIDTQLDWDDLVVQNKTLQQIKEIEVWLDYNDIVLNDWNMKSRIKPGYRILFSGPPGTGKTLTATLLGKFTGKDVYRIDLSMIVSKYIGETEKNLSKLFDKAKNKSWILFFDEADAIFGKRTDVRDAHDKYANQEVSYLLQRIEAHSGLVILATNFRNNIDTAFTRRFQSIIEFENPSYKERLSLWKKNLPNKIALDKSVSLEEISKKYPLTGANIINVVQYICLKTIASKHKSILLETVLEGIKKEYLKEGKMVKI
ncbi:ATPase family associated with various cellular activities (AAA) [Aquimarina amphilecti]|uniref:ATPase family associated with various cellular activities (AAA) n=1 Tax=Aquimarina amphilecti TaxID=1038014 RepID=A0A1H7WPF6_AQUAM|nr:ATP-binding protein [Aquimarina amphilecti]SEM23045.1 ATPase family associated with various cellular activities (AAA) [Aquimarina amphilecti]